MGRDEIIQIIAYTPVYKDAFRLLNEAWIDKYFVLEEEDRRILNDPEKNIIKEGGFIFFAVADNKAVGTCALIYTGEHTYELCKMCVAPGAQGKHLGYRLCEAAIHKATQLNAISIHLETNSKLQAAIHLYKKLGFKEVPGSRSKYERVDTTMELVLR